MIWFRTYRSHTKHLNESLETYFKVIQHFSVTVLRFNWYDSVDSLYLLILPVQAASLGAGKRKSSESLEMAGVPNTSPKVDPGINKKKLWKLKLSNQPPLIVNFSEASVTFLSSLASPLPKLEHTVIHSSPTVAMANKYSVEWYTVLR